MIKIIIKPSYSPLLQRYCRISTCVPHNGDSKIMKKILNGSRKRKHKFYEAPLLPGPKSFSKSVYDGKYSPNSKRTAVLNKLFMRYITDLMVNGDCSSVFLGHKIEISGVEITPDFNCINIYWIGKGTEADHVIDDLLNKNTGALRHELAQLKVVGVIPMLKFIKDKKYAQIVEVERLLAKADFGDYVPADVTSKLKTQLELTTNIKPQIIEEITALENESEIEEKPLPPMTFDTLGLNRQEIVEKIQRSKVKSEAIHRQAENIEHHAKNINESPVVFKSMQEERQAMKDFLNKRQIERNKFKSNEKNYIPDIEILREEWLEKQRRGIDHFELFNHSEEKDFINEDN